MLTDDEKEEVRQALQALREGLPGFRSRRPQLELIAAVARTMAACSSNGDGGDAGTHIAVVEAGTGTGKSFGAFVPALVLARSRGKRLVISSSTVALQEQYATKDAPTLQRVLPFAFTVAVAKGRRRYACPVRLSAAVERADAAARTSRRRAASLPAMQAPRRTVARDLAEAFARGQWSGDRDDLASPVPDATWNELTTEPQACPGRTCPRSHECPFYAARQRVIDADVVIANHDLVLSSLEHEAAGMLPKAEDTMYVFDEAHHLPAKVIDRFSARHAIRGANEWLSEVVEVVRDTVLSLDLDPEPLRDVRLDCALLQATLTDLERAVCAAWPDAAAKVLRFERGALPDWARDAGTDIDRLARDIQSTLSALRELTATRAADAGEIGARLLSELGSASGRLGELVSTWALLLRDDDPCASPVARWIEAQGHRNEASDYVVCAAPITGGEKLRELLWDRASAAVLMSATLSSCGTFDLFLNQAGLGCLPTQQLVQLASPFDYRSHARLVIPAMRSDPANAGDHTAEVVARLPGLVNTLGTLVLFASAKQMRDVHQRLPEDLRAITLVQGDMAKGELLDRHRAAVDRGARSVLFGLQSLAEGVDLPREYCTHVVIAKLPFAAPDSPLEEARREWIESQGRSSFIEVTVPETAIKLKQGLGRLIRTDDDYGTATVLDRRLVSKRWGGLLLKGLPDFELVVERAGSHLRSHGRRAT